jgi:type II secretory pathway pseudopilin PulG
MRLDKQKGFSLIEFVIFTVIIGMIAGSLLMGLNQSLRYSNTPRSMLQAGFLANARLQIILMNRVFNGYAALNDPCIVSPSLAVCTPLAVYATANGLTVSTPTISGSNPKTITVSVSGTGNAVVTTQVYDYASD